MVVSDVLCQEEPVPRKGGKSRGEMPASQQSPARISWGQKELGSLSLEAAANCLRDASLSIRTQENGTCADSSLVALCPVTLGTEAFQESDHGKEAMAAAAV